MRNVPSSLVAWSLFCAVAAAGIGGCKADHKAAPLTGSPSDAGPASEAWVPAIADKSLPRLASGTMDVQNRYASTVMLTEDAETRVANCSGILLSSRVALTAASCVCSPWKAGMGGVPGKRVIDASACARRTFLRSVRYGAVQNLEFKEETTVKAFQTFEGKIRAHPEFQLVLDARGAALSSHADLAVIILDAPLEKPLPFVPLGESEVQQGEVLVMAGYPDDARFGRFSGVRYFRQNKVTEGEAEGRLLYEQQAPFLYNGFTGGPCFREDRGHQWLVGVASVGSDRELSFTSAYFFRDWLRAELQRAAETDSNPAPQPHVPGEHQ